jgi:hypothetical protein
MIMTDYLPIPRRDHLSSRQVMIVVFCVGSVGDDDGATSASTRCLSDAAHTRFLILNDHWSWW